MDEQIEQRTGEEPRATRRTIAKGAAGGGLAAIFAAVGAGRVGAQSEDTLTDDDSLDSVDDDTTADGDDTSLDDDTSVDDDTSADDGTDTTGSIVAGTSKSKRGKKRRGKKRRK